MSTFSDDFDDIDFDSILADVEEKNRQQAKDQAELIEIKTQLEAAQKVVRDLMRERDSKTLRINDNRQELRRLEREAERAKKLKEAQAKRVALLEEFNERAKKLDELTATAKWREFAFDHQITGGKRLAVARRGILADKRGLGKTLTSLIWLDMVEAKRILVLAPNDVVPQFEDEIRTWQPHRTIFSLRGLPQGQRALIYPMLNMVKEFIITLNYEAWRKDKTIIDDLVSAGIDTIICDEAHRIKSSSKITARGVFQVAYRPNYCPNHGVANYEGPWYNERNMPKDRYVGYDTTQKCPACSASLETTVKNTLMMTGTPILNKPQELFSMLHLVDHFRFVSEKQFLQDYCYSYAPGKWRFLPGGLDRLTKSMSEFFVARNRDDAGIHIPPPAITIHRIDKDKVKYPRQYKAEKDLREAAAMSLEDGDVVNMLYILEIILRERQVMTWPAGVVLKIRDENPESDTYREVIKEIKFDVEESQKLDEATDLLMDLCDEEQRTIVFSKFKAPLYEMHNRILKAGFKSVLATGDQSQFHKDKVRRDFDLKTAPKEPLYDVCFATFDAFGTGINLNAARHIIMLDDEWNPGMEDQAIGRIDRLNSVDQANVHIFRVNDSIDKFMEDLLEQKKQLTEGFETDMTAADMLRHLRGDM